jgi:OmpA-OmpF porin, OOP family
MTPRALRSWQDFAIFTVRNASKIGSRRGGVTASPAWSEHVLKALDSGIREIRQGQLQIDGSQVSLAGEVATETTRQQIARDIAAAMGPRYAIANGLRAGSGGEQRLLDQTLADRVVEFESGSAVLTPAGVRILDEMAAAIARLGKPRIEIIGHTDSSGNRLSNVSLSLARADTVKGYLTAKGIAASALVTQGVGPDRPVTSNDTQEGRARNRRIEFRLVE